MPDKFFTDGMTVDQILSLSTEQLNNLDKRELSRALRTVSLAANKRVARLEKEAVKVQGGYVEKKGGKGISPMALNWASEDGKKQAKFGVRQAKDTSRNAIYGELARVRQFMQMKTSTISGAVDVRRTAETMLLGKTREQLGKSLTSEDKRALYSEMGDFLSQAYANYRRYIETEEGKKKNLFDSGSVIKKIGEATARGDNDDEMFARVTAELEENYVKGLEEYERMQGETSFYD